MPAQADAERRAAEAERAARTEPVVDISSTRKELEARERDAAELRGLLRAAVRDKRLLEARVAELRATERRQSSALNDRDGELTAARRAARDARTAFVEDGRSSSDGGGPAGGAEYLRSVVRTALPPRGVPPDSATTARLLPVLRSLLSLPHEHVERNLDALGQTGSGGEFALALVEAAAATSGKTSKVVAPETAAELQRRADEVASQRTLLEALESDATELRAEVGRPSPGFATAFEKDGTSIPTPQTSSENGLRLFEYSVAPASPLRTRSRPRRSRRRRKRPPTRTRTATRRSRRWRPARARRWAK